VGMMLKDINVKFPFGDMKLAKEQLEAAVLALLGPKTEADLAPIKKTKAPKAPKEKVEAAAAAAEEVDAPAADPFKIFPRPQDNNKVRSRLQENPISCLGV
jgi:glutaminyl-tRNA synthetase